MKKLKLESVLRLLALVLIVVFCWGLVRDRLRVANWGVPFDYTGDALQIFGWIQAGSEGDYIPFWSETIHRLGAPYEANWNDYPMYEKILTFSLGILAKWIGLFKTTNFAIVLGNILSAVSFYLCCRFLKRPRLWSFVAAILFSFTYYHSYSHMGHLLLAYSYILPWAMLSCWLVASSRGMQMGDRLSKVCIITALAMGLSNPYNLNMYMQLLCFAILAQYCRERRRENLKVGGIMVAVAIVAFLAINAGTLMYNWQHGKNPSALDRHYYESELYALKPMEFFIPPPTHNVESLAEIGTFYKASAMIKGELFSAYLGVIGMAGLAWIFGEAFLRMVRNDRRTRRFPGYAAMIGWIIIYAVIGGLNCIAALYGIQYFRATNRYSIFISTLILLFLVARMAVCSRKWSPGLKYCVAGGALLLGLFDELPRPLPAEETIGPQRLMESDVAFGKDMEQKLKPGSMVFQMPVMVFPEATPINEIDGYDMLRPYLTTKTLRFSFGSVRGRNREAWQWEVEKLPPAEMISTLEKYGFSAIYLNRKGYADHGEALLKGFAAAGRNAVAEDDRHDQICIGLNPSSTPQLPHSDDRAQILLKSGWAIKEHTPTENRQWSTGNATLSFFSEPKEYTSYSLKCVVGSLVPRRVSILVKDKEVWNGQIGANQGVPIDITIGGNHGNNKIEIVTDEKAVQPRESAMPLAFTLVNLQITKSP